MRFRYRLMLILLIPLLAAVIVSAVLTDLAFNRLNVQLVQSRLDFILANLRTTLEASLGLGLQLDQVPGAQDLIEREQLGTGLIRAIDVFDRNGRSLFSTDRGALGEPVPDSWRQQAARTRTDRVWHVEARGDVVFGLNIDNNLGQIVGSVAITVVPEQWQRRSVTMARFIGALGLAAGAVAVLGAVLAGWWLSRRATRPFDEVTQGLVQPPRPPPPGGELPALVAGGQAQAAAARRALAAAAAELAALDEKA